MGYSKELMLGDSFSYGGTPTSSVTLTTVANDYSIGSVGLPNELEKSSIRRVYIDLLIRSIESSAGGGNWIAGSYWVDVTGVGGSAVTKHAQQWATNMLTMGVTVSPGIHFVGDRDVTDAFQSSSPANVVNVTLVGWACHANNLILYDLQPIARVILS